MPHSDSAVTANLSKALFDITAEVLETMFYLFPEEEPVAEDSPGPPAASVFRFEGMPAGAVVIAVSPGAARTAAANFLAIEEEEPSPERIQEVVCEMANMVGGCLLGCIENRTPLQPFPPEPIPPDAYSGRDPAVQHLFHLEHGSLTVSLYWE